MNALGLPKKILFRLIDTHSVYQDAIKLLPCLPA